MTAKVLINLFAALIEMIIIKDLYGVFGNKNKRHAIIFYPALIIYLAFSIIATMYISSPIILLLINSAIIICVNFAYTIKKIKVAFIVLIHIVMGMSLEIIVVLIIGAINRITPEQFGQNLPLYFQAVIIVKFASYFIARIIKSVNKTFHQVIDSRASGMFLIIPLATMSVLFILSTFIYKIDDRIANNAVIAVSVLLIAANIATFYIYDYMIKQILDKKNAEQHAIMKEQEIKNCNELIRISSISNKRNHDIKHKLYQLMDYIKTGDERSKMLIEEMCTTIDENKIIKYTGLNAVDALINVKRREMILSNITVDVESFVTENINVDSMDMCVIAGNLLNNAAESCNKITDKKRAITLKITQQGGYLTICMVNTFCSESIQIGKTSKNNKHEHGYGLVNVKEIAEKYNGQVSINYSDGKFTTIITLKNNGEASE